MPKLPPPPRRAQKRSLFSFSLAWTSPPSAVTTSAESRLSMVRPNLRVIQPKPPPSVKPATPVVELTPVGTARPKACVSLSRSPRVAPGATRALWSLDRPGPIASAKDRSSVRRRTPHCRRCCGRRRARRRAARSRGRTLRRASRPPPQRSARPDPDGGRSSRSRWRAPNRTRPRRADRPHLALHLLICRIDRLRAAVEGLQSDHSLPLLSLSWCCAPVDGPAVGGIRAGARDGAAEAPRPCPLMARFLWYSTPNSILGSFLSPHVRPKLIMERRRFQRLMRAGAPRDRSRWRHSTPSSCRMPPISVSWRPWSVTAMP